MSVTKANEAAWLNFFSCRGKKVQPGSQIHKLQIFTQAGRWSDFAVSKVKIEHCNDCQQSLL
jgi:hypothetical protein